MAPVHWAVNILLGAVLIINIIYVSHLMEFDVVTKGKHINSTISGAINPIQASANVNEFKILSSSRLCSIDTQGVINNDNMIVNITKSSQIYMPPVIHSSDNVTKNIDIPYEALNLFVPQTDVYFIKTSKCTIPYVDPFSPEIKKIYKPYHWTGCTRYMAIVSAIFDENNGQYILHINYTVAMNITEVSDEDLAKKDTQCCYRRIERSGTGFSSDKSYRLGNCFNFQSYFLVPVVFQAVIINCYSESKQKLIQEDFIPFIQTEGKTDKRNGNKSTYSTLTNGPNNLGVLLIGIDSMSRINFKRTMPKTLKHLRNTGWYEMHGYHKVERSSFRNVIAFLTGYTYTALKLRCNYYIVGGLDGCNIIWSKYRDFGFKTAYIEDSSDMAIFNLKKIAGFLKPPTDHYFRPMALAMEKNMASTLKNKVQYCIGRRQAGEYVYDYALEFSRRYRDQKKFGLFWTNSFSHNSYSLPATMDTTMTNYLRQLEKEGFLQNSVVVFLSDHGMRFGPLAEFKSAYLEESLPLFFISLPPWLEQQYPEYVENLKTNQQRLTTPFDLYMTLQQLLHVADPQYNVIQAKGCSNAKSLFQKIPENRTCKNSCIPDKWCCCNQYTPISPNDLEMKNLGQLIVKEINSYIASNNLTSICSKLSVATISHTRMRSNTVDQESDISHTYMIDLSTKPSTMPTTRFSATVPYNAKLRSFQVRIENIIRKSRYEYTAKCINDKEMKNYCICET